jgi:transcription-repair coupling factor (superfamily II helicase)
LRLLVAHGQMAEGELESAMVAFNAGEADLMLCTTIIESGLDIPRVNTILVEDAQKFGLAQLYQLRGRVGRSGIQAHAWLFFPGEASLSEAARQRLRAIQEFAQLGSGYQLAMRDMEIRGVGNLLGVEQSGQMEAIGFDLYMEMLQECLAELQGQDIPAVDDTQIDLQVTAFIPADWISENDEKMAAYRAAATCCSSNCWPNVVAFRASSLKNRICCLKPPWKNPPSGACARDCPSICMDGSSIRQAPAPPPRCWQGVWGCCHRRSNSNNWPNG